MRNGRVGLIEGGVLLLSERESKKGEKEIKTLEKKLPADEITCGDGSDNVLNGIPLPDDDLVSLPPTGHFGRANLNSLTSAGWNISFFSML